MKHREKIQDVVLAEYAAHGRHDLPWRKTTDLYRVALAEIMLQQTNVPKVMGKYEEFLVKFPRVADLAAADQADVVTAWRGLGYNRRAMNLHRMAQAVMDEHGGVFPETVDDLLALPGVGPYTSRSILAFGRNADVAAIDVNISRVVRRWQGLPAWEDQYQERAAVEAMLPVGKSCDWHNALMDFASRICTKRKPGCAECPLKDVCVSYPAPQDAVEVKKKEPGRSENGKHIPRRIFRGRIVEALRDGDHDADTIGARIKSDWDADQDGEWLMGVLEMLEKDQMIVHKGDVYGLR